MRTSCVQENISCEFYVYPIVPNKLGNVMKYEAKKKMLVICLEMLNIEWGQIDPKGNRKVTKMTQTMTKSGLIVAALHSSLISHVSRSCDHRPVGGSK